MTAGNEPGLPVVVALGAVDPALVSGALDGHCRLVTDPGDADLSIAAGAIARAGARIDQAGWKTLLANLGRLTGAAAARGVRAVLHPHVGTMVERGDEVRRVLEGSAISLCLDTGHLLIGGTDPADLTRQAPDRIAHTHFKDVNDQLAAQVRSGRLT
jgi:sugar phosphate isomerase/epimerase